jgi:hypothetical protein
MAIYVYISEACKKDVRKHSYEKELQNFSARIEKTQTLDLFDRFPPPYLKKRFERQIRLVAAERHIEDHTVVCFLRILTRGSKEYDSGFSKDALVWGEQHLEHLVSDDEIQGFLKKKLESAPLPEKRFPSDEEFEFLHNALSGSANLYADIVCCESKDWVLEVVHENLRNRIVLFAERIYDTAISDQKEWLEVRLKEEELSFLCRVFPDQRKIFLVCPFTAETRSRRNKLVEQYKDVLLAPPDKITEELILKHSIRAYTATVLEDTKLWTDIQLDEKGNMALSHEEVLVLESARQRDAFPLFINGRAGSGKSTILQYLFSEYLYHHLTKSPGFSVPVYFTCSRELLAIARQSVEKLIESRHRVLSPSQTSLTTNQMALIPTAFQEFHGFLYSCLPHDDAESRFPRKNHVNYARFKKLWDLKFSREARSRSSYGPDISWHIIRTYVKGSNSEQFLEPDDYDELPAKQKSVSGDTYRIVYDRVWQRWYEELCRTGVAWDDQDLVRWILDRGLCSARFPCVFCDEAQDFTKIELELLFRLSLFSECRVASDLGRVPFAFAGDPFQTLNPTGFRWEATKASFVENFILKQDPQKRSGKQDLNYCELGYNYRSSKHIVKFCNAIQLLRSVAFDLSEVKPQQAYQVETDPPPVVYFPRSDATALEHLASESEIRIIVPCEEGEEQAFVENDEFLKGFISRDEAGVPKNVISPVRAKGLEFPRVVLYGFGAASPAILQQIIRGQSTVNSVDEALPLEYFINRVYVAASRPKRRLIIIDTAEGINGFWSLIFNGKLQEELRARTKDPESWDGQIAGAVPGRPDSWDTDREKPEETARMLEDEGRTRQDAFFLRQAALSYDDAGNAIKAKECRARALLLEENYTQAGRLFTEIQQYPQAVRAYWSAGEQGWTQIDELASRFASVKTETEYLLAHFLRTIPTFQEGLDILENLTFRFSDAMLHTRAVTEPAWSAALGKFFEKIIQVGEDTASSGLWQVAANRTERLASKGIPVAPELQAQLKYLAGDKQRAYELWKDLDPKKRPEAKFLDAKAATLTYPDKLSAFIELQERGLDVAESIVQSFERGGSAGLTREQWALIVKAMVKTGRLREAYVIASNCSTAPELFALSSELMKNGMPAQGKGLAQYAAQCLVIDQKWKDVLLVLGGSRKQIEAGLGGVVVGELIENLQWELWSTLIRVVSRSEAFVKNATNDYKTRFAETVSKICVSERGKWTSFFSVYEAGSALERAGLDRITLPFYEMVESGGEFSTEQQRFAAERWLKAKQRQAEREDVAGERKRAEKHFMEAEKRALELGVGDISKLPEYPTLEPYEVQLPEIAKPVGIEPSVPPVAEKHETPLQATTPVITTTPPAETVLPTLPVIANQQAPVAAPTPLSDGKMEVQAGGLQFVYLPSKDKLVVRNDGDSMEQISMVVRNRKFAGDHSIAQDPQNATLYRCQEWGIEFDVSNVDSKGQMSVRFRANGLGITFPLGLHRREGSNASNCLPGKTQP